MKLSALLRALPILAALVLFGSRASAADNPQASEAPPAKLPDLQLAWNAWANPTPPFVSGGMNVLLRGYFVQFGPTFAKGVDLGGGSFTGVGGTAGVTTQLGRIRLDLLGVFGLRTYSGVDGHHELRPSETVSGSCGYAGAHGGAAYVFGGPGSTFDVGLWVGYERDLSSSDKVSSGLGAQDPIRVGGNGMAIAGLKIGGYFGLM